MDLGPVPAAGELFEAVRANNKDKVSSLLSRGADIEARNSIIGGTPLHSATFRGSPATVKLLLDRGADVNARANDGNTPLHFAASLDRTDIAKLLIEAGAALDMKNTDGETPLRLAAYGQGHLNTSMLLIGANIKNGIRPDERTAELLLNKKSLPAAVQEALKDPARDRRLDVLAAYYEHRGGRRASRRQRQKRNTTSRRRRRATRR